MTTIKSLTSSRRPLFASALVCSVLAGLGGSALVALVNRGLFAEEPELLGTSLAFAGAALGVLVFRSLSESQFVRLRHGVAKQLRLLIGRRLSEMEFRALESDQQARYTVLTEDVATVSDFFLALPRLVTQGVVVVTCLAYLAWLSWVVFLFAMGIVVAGALGHLLVERRASGHLYAARLEEDNLFGHFQALLSGAKELALHAERRSAFLSSVLTPSIESVRRQRTHGLLIHMAAGTWGSFLFFVVIGGVIFGLGAWLGVPSPVRSAYALTFLYMMHPMELLMESIPEVSGARIALERIRGLAGEGEAAPVAAPAKRVVAAAAPFRSLRLEQVVHRYRRDMDDGVFALGPVSLELRPGELVFLLGGNGSGKTTLAKLVVGLYEPESGSISLDERPVGPGEIERHRETCSAVFSDFHLFESLLGFDAEAFDAKATELLGRFHLGHKVRIEQGVLSTTQLSSGQRKRLALLVALLEDRPLYVFDEWASDQDPSYKHIFYTELLPELRRRGKAVLVISHDERYFHLADRRLRLEAGQLRERAEHAAVS